MRITKKFFVLSLWAAITMIQSVYAGIPLKPQTIERFLASQKLWPDGIQGVLDHRYPLQTRASRPLQPHDLKLEYWNPSANGHFRATISYPSSGGSRADITTSGHQEACKKIPISKIALPPGSIIDEHNIEEHWVPVSHVSRDWVQSPQDAIGQQVVRTCSQGEPLTQKKLQRTPTVEKGQKIPAIFKIPGLRITTSVTALKAGCLGDRIKAQNQESKKTIEGRIEEGPCLVVSSP